MSFIRASGAILMLLAGLCTFNAHAYSGAQSVVYPTGVYPDDVTRVQSAVDRGNTVILKAVNAAGVPTSFNFGTGLPVGQSGGVTLNKDVNILGEVSRSHRTTILGGFLPITSLQPIKTTIQGIDFESPFWVAITIGASTGSAIIDNVFHNIVPVQVRVPSGRIITFAEAIGFSGYDDSGSAAPGLITGNILIAGNTIDGARAIFSDGIQFDSFSANVEITGNKISNVNDDTTETGSGIAVIRAQKNVLIAGNAISPGPTQNIGDDGIFIDGDSAARYLVIGNTINCDAQYADGIDVVGGPATGTTGTVKAQIIANSIAVNGDVAAGIFLYDLVTETQVAANLIRGAGINAFGISTYGFDTEVASLNHFTDNDIRHFVSNQSDLFYDANTQNNTEFGFCRSVVDLGTGNSSACANGLSQPQSLLVPNVVKNAASALAGKQQQRQLHSDVGRITVDQVLRQP
jgi:hypothetical protein